MQELTTNCPDAIHVARVGKADRKRKLSINVFKNVGKCWSCGYRTRDAKAMVERYQLPVDLDRFELIYRGVPASAAYIRFPPDFSTDFQEEPWGPIALHYLLERRLSRATIGGYGAGYSPELRRVIVPVYEAGVLVSYQSRDWTGHQVPKYVTCPGGAPHALFNLDRAAPTKVLLLVEGIFDALQLPEYAVGLLGIEWSTVKRDKILRADPDAVLLACDHDAAGQAGAATIAASLRALVPVVVQVPFTGKDLGSTPRADLRTLRQLCRALSGAATARAGGV